MTRASGLMSGVVRPGMRKAFIVGRKYCGRGLAACSFAHSLALAACHSSSYAGRSSCTWNAESVAVWWKKAEQRTARPRWMPRYVKSSQRSKDLASGIGKEDVRTVEAVRHERRSPTRLFFSPRVPPHIHVVPISDCVGTNVEERTPLVHGQEGGIEDVRLQISQAKSA